MKKYYFVFFIMLLYSQCWAGNIPEGISQNWLDSIISIEVMNNLSQSQPIGTGFVVISPKKNLVLVTAKHVVINNSGIIPGLAYRINEDSNTSSVLITDNYFRKIGAGDWYYSTSDDVACRFIGRKKTSKVSASEYSYFASKDKIGPASPVLILGFPLGLRSEEHALPIVRKGIVARINPADIIVDANVFPGNSGGPVIYKPTYVFGSTIKSPYINEEMIVGLVSSYIPYKEVAVSQQTKQARIIFEENTGLSYVVPADAILKLLNRKDFLDFDASISRRATK